MTELRSGTLNLKDSNTNKNLSVGSAGILGSGTITAAPMVYFIPVKIASMAANRTPLTSFIPGNDLGQVQAASAGDQGLSNGTGIWFMPMYNYQKASDYHSGGLNSGYEASFGGAVIGADYTINNTLRFGATLSIGGGDSESTGDFNKTDNDFNYWGLGLYAGYVIDNFSFSADVGYTKNKAQ